MLRILGRKNSSNVQKVLWAADELGIPYEREDYGGTFGKTKEPEYLALNPNAVVPTIVEDGFVLWESNAIVRYLAAKHGAGGLWPTDLRVRAEADRWMDWQHTTIQTAMTPIFWGLVRTPEAERDKKAIETARLKGIDLWGIVNRYLEGRPYLAGESFTMGDIPLGIQAYRWFTLIQDRPRMANLEAWFERLKARKPFQTHILHPLT